MRTHRLRQVPCAALATSHCDVRGRMVLVAERDAGRPAAQVSAPELTIRDPLWVHTTAPGVAVLTCDQMLAADRTRALRADSRNRIELPRYAAEDLGAPGLVLVMRPNETFVVVANPTVPEVAKALTRFTKKVAQHAGLHAPPFPNRTEA